MGKQSQLLLRPTEIQLSLQVGVEFDNDGDNDDVDDYKDDDLVSLLKIN